MDGILSKYLHKLYFQKWIIGICKDNIEDIIRSRIFDPDIKWLFKSSLNKIYGDPFFIRIEAGKIDIIFEELRFEGDYGRLALITLDDEFRLINYKLLLDTKKHLSYPCVYKENNKYYVFPESSKSGKLSCYEYDPVKESLVFLHDILQLPLLDSTVLKHNEKYWIFGALTDSNSVYEEHVFYSNNLLGPYVSHPTNPVKRGLDGTRPAGNFIEVDGAIYRPVQNCQKEYGNSITIYKLTEINEKQIIETPYMDIELNKHNSYNKGMYKIHTINYINNLIVVDGKNWTLSPMIQLGNYLRKKNILKRSDAVTAENKVIENI